MHFPLLKSVFVCFLSSMLVRFSVAAVTDVPSQSVMGCYLDNQTTPDMGTPMNDQPYSNMTRLSCACQCIDKGLQFAGVEGGCFCHCNSSYGAYGSAECCNSLCTGDSNLLCGGPTTILIIDTSFIDQSVMCPSVIDTATMSPLLLPLPTLPCPVSTTVQTSTTGTTGTTGTTLEATSTQPPTGTTIEATTTQPPTGTTTQPPTWTTHETTPTQTPTSGSGTVTIATSMSSGTMTTTNMTTETISTTEKDANVTTETVTMATDANATLIDDTMSVTMATSDEMDNITTETVTMETATEEEGNFTEQTMDSVSPEQLDTVTMDFLTELLTKLDPVGPTLSTTSRMPPVLQPATGATAGDSGSSTTPSLVNVKPCLSDPPDVQLADDTGTYKERYGVAESYRCHPGYVFDAGGQSRSAVCEDGTWLYIASSCSPVQCYLDMTDPPQTLQVNEEATITCPSDQRLGDGMEEETVRCTSTGSLEPDVQQTCGDYCEPAPLLSHATTVVDQYRRRAIVTCDPGAYFSDGTRTKVFRCNDEGHWTDLTHGCDDKYCPKLPIPQNGALSTAEVSYGTIVIAFCIKSFVFPEIRTEKSLRCQDVAGGKINWNDTVTDCVPVLCNSRPPEILNAEISCTRETARGPPYPHGTNLMYVCQDGRRFEDGHTTAVVSCIGPEYWKKEVYSCDYHRCPPIPHLEYAVPDNNLAISGRIVTYTCIEGYNFPPPYYSVKTVCDGSHWSAINASCRPLKCPPLLVTHGWAGSSETTYGANVTVVCDSGYLPSAPSFVCTAEEVWEPNSEPCIPVDCMSAPVISNARRITDPDATVMLTTFGITRRYLCVDGTWFSRNLYDMSITCDATGTWRQIGKQGSLTQGCQPIVCLPILFHEVNDSMLSIGTVVNASCEDGQWMANGQSSFITECDGEGKWAPRVPPCIGPPSNTSSKRSVKEARGAAYIGFLGLFIVGVVCFLIIVTDFINLVSPKHLGEFRKPRQLRRTP